MNCKKCTIFNDKRKTGDHYPVLIGDAFDRINFDFMGPLECTNKRNKFIEKATDYLTKYVEMAAIHEKSAERIAELKKIKSY